MKREYSIYNQDTLIFTTGYFMLIKTKNLVGKIWEKWQQPMMNTIRNEVDCTPPVGQNMLE
jgi:hypothetical protein